MTQRKPSYALGPILLDEAGREFIATLRELHNVGGPQLRIRYNGSRPRGSFSTPASMADAARIYFDPPKWVEELRAKKSRERSAKWAELGARADHRDNLIRQGVKACGALELQRDEAYEKRRELEERLGTAIAERDAKLETAWAQNATLTEQHAAACYRISEVDADRQQIEQSYLEQYDRAETATARAEAWEARLYSARLVGGIAALVCAIAGVGLGVTL